MIDRLRKKLQLPCEVVDMHVHVYSKLGSYDPPSPEVAAAQILDAADAFGIRWMVVVDIGSEHIVSPDVSQMRQINDNIFKVRDCSPRRFIPFAFLNPALPEESAKELDRCIAHGARGVKLWISKRMNHPLSIELLSYVADKKVPVVQHCADKPLGNFAGETSPADAAECAGILPNLTIILAHLSNIGLRGIEEIRDHGNIIIECSGGDPLSGFIRQAINRLGVERVVFGSDVPCRNFGSQLAKVVNENISEAEQLYILRKNALRILQRGA